MKQISVWPSLLENADIEWQESGAPFSKRFADIYFSREGGIEETHHVFLQANDLPERWRIADEQDQAVFTIAELGFGAGLNFLCCWQLWQQSAPRGLRLHYISCEKYPLDLSTLHQVLHHQALHQALQQPLHSYPEIKNFSSSLLANYPEHLPGYHRLLLRSQDGQSRVTLDLYYGDAHTLLSQQTLSASVDAWFLDGFAPRVNPEMWHDELLKTISRLSKPDATLSSYSVTGRVVRALRSLGFAVEKRPGFGNKRQMLFARKIQAPDQIYVKPATPGEVTIIGAGLAGASTAWFLAQRGFRVTVLEQADHIAAGASGNPQGVVQCRLNRQPGPEWQFNLHSYLFAIRTYSQLRDDTSNSMDWHDCGVLTLDSAFANSRRETKDDSYSHYSHQVLQRLDAKQSSILSGIEVTETGVYAPAGGWINPAQLCAAYLRHPLISVICNIKIVRIKKAEHNWQLFNAEDSLLATSCVVVIANSYQVRELLPSADLPITPVRGQISYIRQTVGSSKLRCVLCAETYIAPVQNSLHCIGASFVKDSTDTSLSAAEQRENILGIHQHATQLDLQLDSELRGRASIRGGSGDFMPMVGLLPDHPHLYLNVGHGSHGLSTTPLCAEYLASLISAELPPLPQDASNCIDVARFHKRARKKGKHASINKDQAGSDTCSEK